MSRQPDWRPPTDHPALGQGGVAIWLLRADTARPLESVAARYLGVDPDAVRLDRAAGGKPVVAGGKLQVNLAHSGHLALVAVAREQEVGVDIELLRADVANWSLPSHALSPGELGRLETVPGALRARAFLALWTQKEALTKAVGLGLAVDVREIELGANAEILSLPAELGALTSWSLADVPVPGYAAAVAVRGVLTRLDLFDARAAV